MPDALALTHKLIANGADRAKVIAIVDGYGDPVDWTRGGKMLTDTLGGKNIYGVEMSDGDVRWFDTKDQAKDWNYHSLDSIIAEVWQSDLNSGDDPENWIINEICRTFGVEEVTE